MSRVAHPPVLPTYARLDVTFVEGVGSWLIADDGRTYLDFAAGIAVVGLGHGHPAVTAAARDQLERLWHVSNLYWTQPMARLAETPPPDSAGPASPDPSQPTRPPSARTGYPSDGPGSGTRRAETASESPMVVGFA